MFPNTQLSELINTFTVWKNFLPNYQQKTWEKVSKRSIAYGLWLINRYSKDWAVAAVPCDICTHFRRNWLKIKVFQFLKTQLNPHLQLLNNYYVRKITIFKIEAGIMTPISHHYSIAEEKKNRKSSGEEKSGEIQNKKLGLGAKSKMKAEFSVSSLHGRVSSQKM